MFNFLFDVSIPCVSLSSELKIGCVHSFCCLVVAFGDGQVDGALITLFNLYRASAAKKSSNDALSVLLSSFCYNAQSIHNLYIRVRVCVFFSVNSATGNYCSVFLCCRTCSASQMIRCQFYGFFNLKQLNLLRACEFVCVCELVLIH